MGYIIYYLSCTVLSLGPILHINGIVKVFLDGYETYMPLTYAILMHIPVFSLARVPSRWSILVVLSLAVLAGYGLKYLFTRCNDSKQMNKKTKSNILFLVVCCLVLFEFLAIPFPMSSAEVPSFYKQIAAEDEDFAILEIPMLWQADVMYYQTLHGKRLVGGYVSRTPENALTFLKITPLIRDLLDFYPSHNDIIDQNPAEIGLSLLNYYNIKYIVLHSGRINSEQLEFATDLIHRLIKVEPQIYENGSMLVYEVKKEPITPFMLLRGGWHDLETWGGIPTRWMDNEASLLVYSDENQTIDLNLQIISFYRPRTLETYVNEILWTQTKILPEEFIIVSMTITLIEGPNIIRFHVPEGCERPCDISELNSGDRRCLSIAVQNVTVAKYK